MLCVFVVCLMRTIVGIAPRESEFRHIIPSKRRHDFSEPDTFVYVSYCRTAFAAGDFPRTGRGIL